MKAYEKEGQVSGTVGAIIGLVIGIGIAVLIMIFVGVLGGQTYQLQEADIASIGNNHVLNEIHYNMSNTTYTALGHGFVQTTGLNVTDLTNASVVDFSSEFDFVDDQLVKVLNATRAGHNFTWNYTWGASDIREGVQNSVSSSFSALEQTGKLMPVVVLAVVIVIVIGLVLTFTKVSGGGGSMVL